MLIAWGADWLAASVGDFSSLACTSVFGVICFSNAARSAAAPPAVAARTASSAVIRRSRTASAMQNDIDVV